MTKILKCERLQLVYNVLSLTPTVGSPQYCWKYKRIWGAVCYS